MERLPRENIEKIGKEIFEKSDIVANHGTSIENAISIMETGFDYSRTSYIIQTTKNVVSLCTYGWKENEVGNAANVIISVPKSFFKNMLNMREEDYNKWINNIINHNFQNDALMSVSYIEMEKTVSPIFKPMMKVHIPREFIKGMFIYTDNTNYLRFVNNLEEGLEHLTYIENKYYYENLTKEEQEIFTDKMREKILGSEDKSESRTR